MRDERGIEGEWREHKKGKSTNGRREERIQMQRVRRRNGIGIAPRRPKRLTRRMIATYIHSRARSEPHLEVYSCQSLLISNQTPSHAYLKVAVHLKLEQSLRDGLLKLVGLFPGWFHYLGRRGIHLRPFFLTNFFYLFF